MRAYYAAILASQQKASQVAVEENADAGTPAEETVNADVGAEGVKKEGEEEDEVDWEDGTTQNFDESTIGTFYTKQ